MKTPVRDDAVAEFATRIRAGIPLGKVFPARISDCDFTEHQRDLIRQARADRKISFKKANAQLPKVGQTDKPVTEIAPAAPAPRLERLGKKMKTLKVPSPWGKWCGSGRHGHGARKKNAVLKCLNGGHVRGYFSDLPLQPDLEDTHSMYPSFEHLVDPSNHGEAVVEARIINDMKSHLSEEEFWRVIEHLFIVGVEKRKILAPFGKRLPKNWSPQRHYKKRVPKAAQSPTTAVTPPAGQEAHQP